ncbi:MAG: hypothetical protein ABI421_16695 [Polyangiaceae bacterium]
MRMASAFLLSLIFLGCSHETTTVVAIQDSGDPGCNEAPSISCSTVTPSDTSCTGGTTGSGASLPLDASFAPGCQAYFRGADCSSRGFCTCDPIDDAGTPAHWNCHDTDGGT